MKTIIEHKKFNSLAAENAYISTMLDTHNLVYRQGGCDLYADRKPFSDVKDEWSVEYCWVAKPQRYPVAYHTVDIAVFRVLNNNIEYLMIQKEAELGSGKWRFPGGFMDPGETAEAAASRELREETSLTVKIEADGYVGSYVIDDPRYKNTPDGITTSFYCYYLGEAEAETSQIPAAADDAAAICWIPSDDLILMCNPVHLELAKDLIARK